MSALADQCLAQKRRDRSLPVLATGEFDDRLLAVRATDGVRDTPLRLRCGLALAATTHWPRERSDGAPATHLWAAVRASSASAAATYPLSFAGVLNLFRGTQSPFSSPPAKKLKQ